MNDELRQFQPQVMAVLGGSLQYLRGYAAFPEWAYHLIALVLACAGYALFNGVVESDWRETAVRLIVGVSGLLPTIWGGTFIASNAAKMGAAFVPKTDSK